MAELKAGITLERTYPVTHALTAAALTEGDPDGLTLPPVWSTPDMVAKMEIVSAALVMPHLTPGQLTVGARNEVSHLAATPIGMTVRVRATLSSVEGRKLTFAVDAFDEQEKVGEGIHTRYILDRVKFESRLAEKARR